MKNEKRAHIFVSGKVQGVFFRDTTRKKASSLGLSGYVKNLPDGRVEIVAEGGREKIEDLISWADDGPPLAFVEDVKVRWEDPENSFLDFQIK